MRATCPNNAEHKRFVTTAHVMEEWIVDPNGYYVETSATLQTTHGPDIGNCWSCAICGSKATVVP